MATASGQVTNAVFGFTSMLLNLIKDQDPDGVVVAFDRPEPTFRHEMLPEYKAQRDPTPELLIQQFEVVPVDQKRPLVRSGARGVAGVEYSGSRFTWLRS